MSGVGTAQPRRRVPMRGNHSGIIALEFVRSEANLTAVPPLKNPCGGGLESAGVTDRILLGLEDVPVAVAYMK